MSIDLGTSDRSVDIILDLRGIYRRDPNPQAIQSFCRQIVGDLVGRPVALNTRQLVAYQGESQRSWAYEVIAAHGITTIEETTEINIVDVICDTFLRHR